MASYEEEIFADVVVTAYDPWWNILHQGDIYDSATLYELLGTGNQLSEIVSESVELTPLVDALAAVLVLERVRISETYQLTATYRLALAEAIEVLDALTTARAAAVAEGVELADATAVARAVTVLEELGIADVLLGKATFGVTATAALRLTAALLRYIGGDISEEIEITPDLAVRLRGRPTITETVEIEDAITPLFLLSVVLEEQVDITAESLLRMIYQPTVFEGVELSIGYLSPGGGFTAWNMNTRTGAVTEYDNFEFNSFIGMGSQYIGASSLGLYELQGETDDGDDIIARIKGGFMQFGGPRLSRLKSAYIAARGNGGGR